MATAQNYRDQSVEELEAILREMSAKLFTLRNEKKMAGKVEKPHLLRETRREIARLLTVLGEKQK